MSKCVNPLGVVALIQSIDVVAFKSHLFSLVKQSQSSLDRQLPNLGTPLLGRGGFVAFPRARATTAPSIPDAHQRLLTHASEPRWWQAGRLAHTSPGQRCGIRPSTV